MSYKVKASDWEFENVESKERVCHETCPECNGTKQMMMGYVDSDNGAGHSFYVPCKECGGAGVIYFVKRRKE